MEGTLKEVINVLSVGSDLGIIKTQFKPINDVNIVIDINDIELYDHKSMELLSDYCKGDLMLSLVDEVRKSNDNSIKNIRFISGKSIENNEIRYCIRNNELFFSVFGEDVKYQNQNLNKFLVDIISQGIPINFE